MRASMSRALARAICAGSRCVRSPGRWRCRDQALDVLVIERLAARDRVEEVPVDAHHEMPRKVHALDRDLGARADGDPDGRACDRDAGAALEHRVEVVGARVAAARSAKAEAVSQERADQRGVGRPAPVQGRIASAAHSPARRGARASARAPLPGSRRPRARARPRRYRHPARRIRALPRAAPVPAWPVIMLRDPLVWAFRAGAAEEPAVPPQLD